MVGGGEVETGSRIMKLLVYISVDQKEERMEYPSLTRLLFFNFYSV